MVPDTEDKKLFWIWPLGRRDMEQREAVPAEPCLNASCTEWLWIIQWWLSHWILRQLIMHSQITKTTTQALLGAENVCTCIAREYAWFMLELKLACVLKSSNWKIIGPKYLWGRYVSLHAVRLTKYPPQANTIIMKVNELWFLIKRQA